MTRSRIEGVEVVAAAGEIDSTSAGTLGTVLEQLAVPGAQLVVDLSGVEFMGSVGLTTLLVASKSTGPQGVRVVASPQVRRPIEVTGLDAVLPLFDTLEAAIAGVSRRADEGA
ncbi:STAS domain-containing protein [Nocardia sp. CDC153]|uniref:STAS domain-containing protein n=1 Tax=Nocardia sp. CDC153 TaxID=3112167 RepID=UPI002DB5F955|nr:STAS domain-containing protein [Nocardia sp. CDC153]MEC3952043.1 STAS domain-containing protein [Nocardia sp. CDC153]